MARLGPARSSRSAQATGFGAAPVFSKSGVYADPNGNPNLVDNGNQEFAAYRLSLTAPFLSGGFNLTPALGAQIIGAGSIANHAPTTNIAGQTRTNPPNAGAY
jgi:hypothetical protein